MKETVTKFESEVDYWRFIDTIAKPEVFNGNAEFDQSNDILIIKQQN